jgi:hypothetical protein
LIVGAYGAKSGAGHRHWHHLRWILKIHYDHALTRLL